MWPKVKGRRIKVRIRGGRSVVYGRVDIRKEANFLLPHSRSMMRNWYSVSTAKRTSVEFV